MPTAMMEDPDAIRESMRKFSESVESVDEIERAGEHIGEWVAAYGGDVVFAETHDELIRKVDHAGFVRADTETRFMEDGSTVLIL